MRMRTIVSAAAVFLFVGAAAGVLSGVLTSSAIQNPTISIDMITTGNAYVPGDDLDADGFPDPGTNHMTVGTINNCLTAPAPGSNLQHNHTTHLIIQNVEDLIAWQVRMNYLGDQMRPSTFGATMFTDTFTGQAVGFVNLPIDGGVHRGVIPASSIPAVLPGPQTALIGAVYNGAQTFPVSADTPQKAVHDETNQTYGTTGGGILASLTLQVLAGNAGNASLFMNLDDGSPNPPESNVTVFNGTGTTTIPTPVTQLGDGYHGEGVTCVPQDCVVPECGATVPFTRTPTPPPTPTPTPPPCFGSAPTIVGTEGANNISGTSGDDVIHGLGGNDSIHGLEGNDKICGGDGDDFLDGGAGVDELDGGPGIDLCIQDPSNPSDTLASCEGVGEPTPSPSPTPLPTSTPTPAATPPPCFGSAPTIVGTGGPDNISGTSADDVIHGLGGNDTIYGLAGNDKICGGDGDDSLDGGAGVDQLDGGPGTDVCTFPPGDTVVSCEILGEPTPSPTPSPTPCPTNCPTPTPPPTPTPTPGPTATPTPVPGEHDVGRAGGGFSTSGRAPGTSTAADVNDVKIKVKNFGTIAETDVPYSVSGSCAIDSSGDGDALDCGSVVYSAACTGNAAALSGDGDLDPGEVVTVSGCTATYGPNAAADTGDTWTHVLMITHCGADGGPPCAGNDGGTDSNPSNNVATKNTKVLP